MKELAPILLVLAAQITLPVVVGLILSRRRNPAAASGPLVLAAVAVLLLTPLAFVPKLDWTIAKPRTVEANASTNVDAGPEPAASAAPGIDLIQLMKLAKPTSSTVEPAKQFSAWRVVGWAFAGIAAVGLLRLALGLCSTIRVVRRSRPIRDAYLEAVSRELARKIGLCRSIALRESERVGSAATVGVWRPMVLLSPEWRQWSGDECCAVLAHEIAHIARQDFLSRLLSRLALALHGYHPLLRWLNARLELRQEMAADAVAASACGGNEIYLRTLAAIALKADARPIALAPTFLSRPQTLFRRIAMLRVKDDNASRTRRWPALLAVALVSASALGLRGTTPDAFAGPVIQARLVVSERPPLDASHVLPSKNEDEVGIFAARLGELLRTPGMEKNAEMYSGVLTQAFGDAKKTHFKLTDIEQISGRVSLTHRPEMPKPNSSLSMSLTSVRMAKDFDWLKQLKEWGTEWKEHSYAGSNYYSSKMTLEVLGFKDTTVWFYLPDSRTMVLEGEANIKLLIDAKKKPREIAWAQDWKAVEDGMFAIVLPELKNKLPKKLAGAEKENAELFKAIAGLCSKAERAAIGVDIGEGCSFKARFACANADNAAEVDEGCQTLLKLAQTIFAESSKDEAKEEAEKASRELCSLLLRGVEFNKTVDHVVEVRITAKTGMKALLEAFANSPPEAKVEKK